MAEKVQIDYVSGPTGPSLYINDYRVAGPKPWGGGKVLKSWKTDSKDILDSLKVSQTIRELKTQLVLERAKVLQNRWGEEVGMEPTFSWHIKQAIEELNYNCSELIEGMLDDE